MARPLLNNDSWVTIYTFTCVRTMNRLRAKIETSNSEFPVSARYPFTSIEKPGTRSVSLQVGVSNDASDS